jgi:hypothetical protein
MTVDTIAKQLIDLSTAISVDSLMLSAISNLQLGDHNKTKGICEFRDLMAVELTTSRICEIT